MPHELFLSHDSRDRAKAEALAKAINRVTLKQLLVWHSSDTSSDGGLYPGNVWLDEIRNRLSTCKAVVALITPVSISRPWLFFESGFGAAHPECDVIPVCIGINSVTEVPFPLAMYQTYQLSDYDSLKRFFDKLLSKYRIEFDEEIMKPVLHGLVEDIVKDRGDGSVVNIKNSLSLEDVVFEIKDHLDKRILNIINNSNSFADQKSQVGYEFELGINFRGRSKSVHFIEIVGNECLEDILNKVFFTIKGSVESFKYLEQWILRNCDTKRYLIVKGVQDLVPANVIFTPNSKWDVFFLDHPYINNGLLPA
jgi:hypothetical protein